MNSESSTPFRKQIKPNVTLFDSAIKESTTFSNESVHTPFTPNKSAKTRHFLNIDTPKCALTPTHPRVEAYTEAAGFSDNYFCILPSSLFKDIPSLPSSSNEVNEWIERNIKNIGNLGSGGFSVVYTVEDINTNKRYALKKISLKSTSSSSVRNFRREIINLWRIKGSKNCVQIFLGWEDNSTLNILTDLFKISLSDFLILEIQNASKGTILGILLDLCEGLNEIHSKNIIHLDLKPENIFLSEDIHAYIGDFGMSQDWLQLDQEIDCEGDRRFLDPLVLSGLCSTSSDIYSLGLIGLIVVNHMRDPKPQLVNLEILFTRCTSLNLRERPQIVDIKIEIQNLLQIT